MKQLWTISVGIVFVFLVALVHAQGKSVEKSPDWEEPRLHMRFTESWGPGVVEELNVSEEGHFHYKANERVVQGQFPSKVINSLILKIGLAGDGPPAEDAGYVELKWIDEKGRKLSRDYSYPSKAPCDGILKEIRSLVDQFKE